MKSQMMHNPRELHFFNSLDIAIILPSLAAFLPLLPHFNERSAPHLPTHTGRPFLSIMVDARKGLERCGGADCASGRIWIFMCVAQQ